jgi:hypothetical protein
MPYSIETKDGIVIDNIPDNIKPDDPSLKERVQQVRASAGMTAPEPQTQEPSLRQRLGRQAGLTGRALTEGALGAVDVLSTPIRAGLEQVLGHPIQPAGPMIANMLGLPQPQTPTERIVQDVSQAVIGAGTGAGVAGLARPVSRVGQAIQGALTAAPGVQQTAAGLSAAASGATREMGGGETAQMATGLVAPLALAPVAFATARRGAVPKPQQQTLQEAQKVGYKITPTEVNPSIIQQGMKGISGKIATQQAVSVENQATTNNLAKQALGVPTDQTLSLDTLSAIRSNAGQAYENLAQTGRLGFMTTGLSRYNNRLDKIAEPFKKIAKDFPGAQVSPVLQLVQSSKFQSADAASVLARIRQLRTAADDAFRSGNTDIGRASRGIADAMEDALETHLSSLRSPEILNEFRNARQAIAKTYTVEKALNNATGNVDASILASELRKKRPLTNELKQVAKFAQAFPKEVQMPEKIGGAPGITALDVAYGGVGAALTGNPSAVAAIAARPSIRSLITSTPYQRLMATPGGPLASQRFAPREIVGAGLLGPVYAEQ